MKFKNLIYRPTKEPAFASAMILALTMLIGKEYEDFCYMELPKDDPDWWVYYFILHRN